MTADQAQDLDNAVAVETGEARLVAGYEVVAKIGQGGMGAVYKAKKLDSGEFVALKILLPSLATPEYVKRFERESRVVRKLHHENIVGWVEFGRDDRRGFHFCALELVEGEDLDKRVERQGVLSEEEAVSITCQVTKALQHAYFNGLVHRDVKPSNVKIAPDGTAKLMDLGLARPVNVQEGDYTLAAWFKADSLPKTGTADEFYCIVMKRGCHLGTTYSHDSRLRMHHWLAPGKRHCSVRSRNTYEPGAFHHVAGVVRRSAGTLEIYVDGRREGQKGFKPDEPAREYGRNPWRIGIGAPRHPQYRDAMHGLIDEVRIYDRALTAAEVSALAGVGGVKPPARLRGRSRSVAAKARKVSPRPSAGAAVPLARFDSLISKGDYAGARRYAEAQAAKPAIRRGAESLVGAAGGAAGGAEATLVTTEGKRTGEGVVLSMKIRRGRQVMGETRLKVAWSDLAPAEEDRLARKGGWKAEGAEGALARAIIAFSRKDLDAAGQALKTVRTHPLLDHYSRKIKELRQEAAATREEAAVRDRRVTDGLQALYLFNEGKGRIVHDVSGVGRRLNLAITGNNCVWLRGGGLSFRGADQKTITSGTATPNKFFTGATASNELSIEAWIRPHNLTQVGPARIVVFDDPAGAAANKRNCGIGQEGKEIVFRIRTTDALTSALNADCMGEARTLYHVVCTYRPGDGMKTYVNGAGRAVKRLSGTFATWRSDYVLSVGNRTRSLDRAWQGDIFLAALYSRALTQAEVRRNFDAGPGVRQPRREGQPAPPARTLTLDLGGGGVTMELVYIKPGVFMMGGNEDPNYYWQGVEKPKHEVAITRGFYIGKYDSDAGAVRGCHGRQPEQVEGAEPARGGGQLARGR